MAKTASWNGYHRTFTDGRPYITVDRLKALEQEHRDRVLASVLAGRPSKVLFLDVPFKVGDKCHRMGIDAHLLHRIILRDIPGWPPRLAAPENGAGLPSPLVCAVKTARLDRDGIEFSLAYGDQAYSARLAGCPRALLKCVLATIEEQKSFDARLLFLQDMRLGAG